MNDSKFFLFSKTVLLAIFGGLIARTALFLGISEQELIEYMLWGFPALMVFARQLTADGLRWVPYPIRIRLLAFWERMYPAEDRDNDS